VHVVSAGDIRTIGAVPQPILRNLRITHAYHELSLAVAERLGPGANWCTFATWASRQAGQTIRGDDLGRAIEQLFARSDVVPLIVGRLRDLRRALGRRIEADTVLRALRETWAPLLVVARVADAVARGNKKVFDEIGLEFARFVAVGHDAPADAAALEAFCDGLRPGDPPDGQRLLAAAFRGYHRARALADPKLRAERMLLANLQIGLHEQTRLQPEIAEALDTSVPEPHEVKQRLVDALVPPSEGAGARVGRAALDRLLAPLVERLRARARAVITAELMTLALPGGVLRLGRDVTGQFPASLLTLADAELVTFLEAVDPTPDTPLGSGSMDWAVLLDRMHFIADLFRTRHEDATLLDPPFTAEQLRHIADGRVPAGAL
jgi:hypothetical protein